MMEKKITFCVGVFLFIHVLLCVPFKPVRAETIECNSCSDCSTKIQSAQAGDVIRLTNDISATQDSSCINLNGKSGITFDGGGYGIKDGASVNYGIYSGTSGGTGNVIKKCVVSGFTNGIYMVYGGSNTVTDCTFTGNNTGINLYSSDSNILQNLKISDNFIGISLLYDSDDNTIKSSYITQNITAGLSFSPRLSVGDPESNTVYNNYFNNSGEGNVQVVKISSETDRVLETDNFFSLTDVACEDENILGCGCMGGNYWGSPDGNGFSSKCDDLNSDGICDDAFDFSQNGATMIDAFALTEPLEGCCANPDKDGDGFNSSSCGGSDCDDNPSNCGAACHPGAVEICDGYDNDCNGEIDDNIACKDTLIKKSAHYPSIIGDHSCAEDSSTHMIYCFGGIDKASTNEPQTDTVVKYDPATDTVTTMAAKLPSIRDGLSCQEDASTHKIYCFGGYAQEFYCTSWDGASCVGGYSISHYLDDILEYDPKTDTLSEKNETLPTGIDGLSCVENAVTHKIYCLGGASSGPNERNTILEYDPSADALSTMSAVLPSGRYLASCARDSSSNKIYCFGGRSDAGSLDEIIAYDPAADTVTTMAATFPLVINRLSCVEDSASHKIYCFGGHSTDREYLGSYYVDKIFEYEPSDDTLTMMDASFTHGRYSLSCAQDSSSNKIYCIGGSRNVVCHDDIHEYIGELWLPGDFDHDCSVGASDLAVFASSFGKTGCSTENICQGDFTADLDVDGRDLVKIGRSFGLYDCP